jgi:DNA-binding NtrC family response regulator
VAPGLRKSSTRILIIDVDLGAVCWLADKLLRAGYEVVPATSIQEAVRLISEIRCSVDLLVADSALDTAGIMNAFAALGFTRPPTIRTELRAALKEADFDLVARNLLHILRDHQ